MTRQPDALASACMGIALIFATAGVAAQTVYVTDQLRAGLHEEKMPDSPIIKTVPTGTALEIIKREEEASFVREPDGASGWIDNSYLVANNPGTPPQVQAENRIRELEEELTATNQEIRKLKAEASREPPPPDADVKKLREQNNELQSRLKAEKLKAGELQVEMSELRKRLGMNNEKEALYREIETFKQQNKQLEVQLAQARDVPEDVKKQEALAARGSRSGMAGGTWQRLLVYLGLTLFVGLALGVYIMDVINRRRHGGFRV